MPSLVLGPLVRHAGAADATVWVETDAPCAVEILGCRGETFEVEGHHYALVHVTGLEPGAARPYEVHLDGERAWPLGGGLPPSVLRGVDPAGPVTVVFGSCRVCYPHEPPWSLSKDEHPQGREADALRALAMRMAGRPPAEWPDSLLLLGDQIYADEVAPETRAFMRARRDTSVPPGETLADFEEYTRLYRESWSEPWIRWLLSTVPTAMIFDDHDVHDDWNTSADWVSAMRGNGWWDERIVGGFMSYWLYQHLGNLDPASLERDVVLRRVREDADGGRALRDFAWRADRTVETAQWSFSRDIGPARLVMVDSRAGRVLEPGRRSMVDAREWEFVRAAAREPHRHLLLGTSLPWLLAPGMHYLEAWNEAVCDGAWGRWCARGGERLRQAFDLEHWAAFRDSFDGFCEMVRQIAAGECGEPPATIVALSGDVHHAYLSEVAFRDGGDLRSRVYQAVCSPFRNPLAARERRAIGFATSRAGTLVGRSLARAARVPDPPVRWRTTHRRPWFDNMVATLRLDAEGAALRFERASGSGGAPTLHPVYERAL